MTHLYGYPMEGKKNLLDALASIPGIGRKRAQLLCEGSGFSPRGKWENLTSSQRKRFQDWIYEWMKEEALPVGLDYLRARQEKRAQTIELGSRRGIRLRMGLPVRGQRTRTNARTSRQRRP